MADSRMAVQTNRNQDDQQSAGGQRTHESRLFAEAGPDECPACHGGQVGYWLCELPRHHAGWHRDTQEDGRVWMWRDAEEIAGCIPEHNQHLTGHFERPDCTHG